MAGQIIIDADPGLDDAVAILMALAAPELEILGITTVAGNAPLPQTTRNALKVLGLAGRTDIPVFAGADRPLVRRLETAEAVHGSDALGDCNLPPPAIRPQARHAVDWIIDTIMERAPGSVTLCCLAPLSNIALALAREPRVATRLAGILAMGGSFFAGGNSDPGVEFNIQVDPHAAAIVLASGAPVTLAPLDLTHQALLTPDRIASVAALPNAVAEQAARWMRFYSRYDSEKFGWPGGPLHDPCIIAALLRPNLFRSRRINVEIELAGRFTTGMTIFDWWGSTGRPANCDVLSEIDADGVFSLVTQAFGSYGP